MIYELLMEYFGLATVVGCTAEVVGCAEGSHHRVCVTKSVDTRATAKIAKTNKFSFMILAYFHWTRSPCSNLKDIVKWYSVISQKNQFGIW